MTTAKFYMVFDVESVGLHGESFAVGWVVMEPERFEVIDEGIIVARYASHTTGTNEWVEQNVISHLPAPTVHTPFQMREAFWAMWREWAQRGAHLYADCGWPVEARFLAACVDQARYSAQVRDRDGPFPLHEIADWYEAAGVREVERLPNELPEHNPLNDARASARGLAMAIKKLRGAGACTAV